MKEYPLGTPNNPRKTFGGVLKDTRYRDAKGEMIYFPKNDRPYFDKALQRVFHSKKQKCEYMRKNKIIMDGSSDPYRFPIEAGDNRFTKVR